MYEGYTKISRVQVRLNGPHAWPLVLGNSADPAVVEGDVKVLAEAIMQPGYPTKARPERRKPYVFIADIPDEYRSGEFEYDIPADKKGLFHTPVGHDECVLEFANDQDSLTLNFNSVADRKPFRKLRLSHENLQQTIEEYHKFLLRMEDFVRNVEQEFLSLPEDASDKQRSKLHLKMVWADYRRRNTHVNGSDYIYSEARRGGILLRNPSLTQDIEMRVFELLSLLMLRGQDYPSAPIPVTSRRKPGQFKNVYAAFPQGDPAGP